MRKKKKPWQSKEGGKVNGLFYFLLYHFEIVQRHQTRIVVERHILRLCERLLHQLRVGPAQDRVDDAWIEVRPPREGNGAGRRVGVVVGVAGIFDSPTEKALHGPRTSFKVKTDRKVQR